tara:strand:+ start:79 stop:450 length:372 start_codon:yes stop_codon:yes gene_type:complete
MANVPLIISYDSDGNPDGFEEKKDLVLDSATIAGTQFGEVGDVVATFVPPKMTTTERNALTAATGMLIYNTTTNLLNHYNGSAWLAVGAVAAGASETKAFYDGLGGTQTVTILNGLITSWVTS